MKAKGASSQPRFPKKPIRTRRDPRFFQAPPLRPLFEDGRVCLLDRLRPGFRQVSRRTLGTLTLTPSMIQNKAAINLGITKAKGQAAAPNETVTAQIEHSGRNNPKTQEPPPSEDVARDPLAWKRRLLPMPAFRVSRHRPHQKNRLHWHCKSQGDARRLGLESSKPPQTQGSLAASGPVSRLRKLRSPNPYKPRSPRSAKAENRPNHLVCLVRVLLARQVPIGLFHLRRNEEAKGLLRWRASRSHREKPRSPAQACLRNCFMSLDSPPRLVLAARGAMEPKDVVGVALLAKPKPRLPRPQRCAAPPPSS